MNGSNYIIIAIIIGISAIPGGVFAAQKITISHLVMNADGTGSCYYCDEQCTDGPGQGSNWALPSLILQSLTTSHM